jgi:hypothetical protein
LEKTHPEPAVRDARWPNLRRTVFVPLAGTIVLLLLALGFAALWSESRSKTERLTRSADTALRLFELVLLENVDTLQVAAGPLLSDPAILERFQGGDREGLLALTKARFDALSEQHGITHMYFADADRVVFLRMHQPDIRGDVINRVTMLEAQKTGQPASGFELGVLGDPMLAVVSPIEHEGRIVGYLGLGREVERSTDDISRIVGIDLHVLIRKDLLVEEEWVKRQALHGREADWERFDEFVAAGPAEGGGELGIAIDETI